jgi:Family of unknown function (DUF5681)
MEVATKEYPNLKSWKPGQSGNPAGKPPGTRTAFSQGFIRDGLGGCSQGSEEES